MQIDRFVMPDRSANTSASFRDTEGNQLCVVCHGPEDE